jgi:hypothetical protein
MALTGRRPAEIFFSSLPRKKLPFPAVIFEQDIKIVRSFLVYSCLPFQSPLRT